jgi:putative cell wall-binding protein
MTNVSTLLHLAAKMVAQQKRRARTIMLCIVLLAVLLSVSIAVIVDRNARPDSSAFAHSEVPSASVVVPNGDVNAIATDGTTTYIGGTRTTQVGEYTGSGVPVDLVSAAPIEPYPLFDSIVYAVASDGAGGWYVGGDFTYVGGVDRSNLAHVLADGSVDPDWNPSTDFPVKEITLSGSNVYIGGDFSVVAGQTRFGLAALDATTGALTSWDPNPSGFIAVTDIVVDGVSVYVAGTFTSIGGVARNGLAEILATTGAITSWDPAPNTTQQGALVVTPTLVYVGGGFTNIGGAARATLAAIDRTTALATSWNPTTNGMITSLDLEGTTIYVGGSFTAAGGSARRGLAAISTTTDLATAWDPAGASTLQVSQLEVLGSSVYVANTAVTPVTIGGQSRFGLSAIDTTTGLATSWNPKAGKNVNDFAIAGDELFMGGEQVNVGATDKTGVIGIDNATGALTGLSAEVNASATILALALDGTTLYVGGTFTSIGGQLRNRIAAIDLTTGLVTGWNPNANGPVRSLAVTDTVVYAGSGFGLGQQFTSIGGQSRNRIAALDKTTGLATTWNPNSDNRVDTIVATDAVVYVGGNFTTIGGASRNRLAALDSTTGLATSWNPAPTKTVGTPSIASLILDGSSLFVGGLFDGVGGSSRANLASVDTSTGLATSWNPGASDQVRALAIKDESIYVAGSFLTIAGQPLVSLAQLDKTTGTATAWNPWTRASQSNFFALSSTDTLLSVGGGMPAYREMRPFFAQYVFSTTQFSVANSTVSESDGTDTIQISLSAPDPGTVTVAYAVTGGTAINGTDFALADGTATFAPGQTTVNIPFTVAADTLLENSEDFVVTLSDPSIEADLGSPTQHTVTITNVEPTATPTPGDTVTRISGATPRELAINVSKENFPTTGSAAAGIIATEDRIVDALVSVPLASVTQSTLLLTSPGHVPAEVIAELERALGPSPSKTVYIAGGTDAISQTVEDQLRALGYVVARFAGEDRNHTAALIADEIVARNPAPTTEVFLSENRSFADVLGGGSAAGHLSDTGVARPILLVERASASFDTTTHDFLAELTSLELVTIIGGPLAVDPAIATALDAIESVDQVTRLEGADRYATNIALNRAVFNAPTSIMVTNGTQLALPGAIVASSSSGIGFFGALLAGTIGARLDAPTLITTPDALPVGTRQYIQENASTLVQAIIIGTTEDVSADIEADLKTLIQ